MRDDPENPIVRVVFRTWTGEDGGDTIALFPDLPATVGKSARQECESFMHVGQHAAADYTGVMRATRPATAAEAEPLRRELENAPYHYRLRAVRRR